MDQTNSATMRTAASHTPARCSKSAKPPVATVTVSALTQTVFATDYPQAVRDADEVAGYVNAVRALGPNARALLHSVAAKALIPDIERRLRRG